MPTEDEDKYLRYLHLSDLHFSSGDMKGDKWVAKALDQDIVTKTMLEHIGKLDRKIDFIIVTGDIAQSGKKEEYTVAAEFIRRLRGVTKLPPENIFVVPGNHDVDRSKIKKWHLKAWYLFENQDDITETLSDEEALEPLMQKFSEFNDFAEIAMGRRLFKDTTYHMVDSLSFEKVGQKVKVALAGINSALFAGYDGDDKQRLALGMKQVDRAMDQLDKEAHLSIGFFHHPFECFHKEDDVSQKMLKDKLDLILTGHTHEPNNSIIWDAGAKVAQVGAGAGFEKRKYENSFNVVEIDLETGKGNIEFHKYLHKSNRWTKNHDLNLNEKDRTFKFEIEKMKGLVEKKTEESSPAENKIEAKVQVEIEKISAIGEPQKTKIHFIHNYLLPTDFTGRQDELKRLREIACNQVDPITKNQSVLTTVRAIGGMGKSCLIRKLVDGIPKNSSFRHIIWFSFYEARTEDLSFFFKEILECLNKLPQSSGEGQTEVRELRKALFKEVEATPVLLVLDGLEVIQSTIDKTSPHYGEIAESHIEIKEFLSRICNQKKSSVVVTSRVSLRDFDGVSGYVEIPLETFSAESGGLYLDKLGVKGNKEELEACSKTLGGYALCLKAAGKFMTLKSIPANEVHKVVGEPAVFEKTTQGEKVNKLYTNYLEEMTDDQKYFLERMSIHIRSVTSINFKVLVKDYKSNGRDESWVKEHVIEELEGMGLIEVLNESDDLIYYSAHPLMKFAFASTMDEEKQKITHEDWAKAAEQAPGNKSIRSVESLEDLQPYLDAIEHYFESGNYEEAWRLFYRVNVSDSLERLGYPKREFKLAKKFELTIENGCFEISQRNRAKLYYRISRTAGDLDLDNEWIEYRKKAFNTAEETGIEFLINDIQRNLVIAYAKIGSIDMAINLKTEDEFSLGRLELYCGNFETSIAHFNEAEKGEFGLNHYILHYLLGYCFLKVKKIREAEKILVNIFDEAKENRYHSTISYILKYLILLELKKGNPKQARDYQGKRREAMESGDYTWEDDPFLLIAEKRFDEAIYLAEKYISTKTDEKINKADEIASLLALSQAWYGKKGKSETRDYLERARVLMEKTGCWKDKDILEETEAMLAKAGK
jgi:predicted MPP superfamily phosphohydrolase/tetratricopeptide (TPR) repeat protein